MLKKRYNADYQTIKNHNKFPKTAKNRVKKNNKKIFFERMLASRIHPRHPPPTPFSNVLIIIVVTKKRSPCCLLSLFLVRTDQFGSDRMPAKFLGHFRGNQLVKYVSA